MSGGNGKHVKHEMIFLKRRPIARHKPPKAGINLSLT